MTQIHEKMAQWVTAWKKADIALQKVRRRDLQEFNYIERRDSILGLLELAYQFRSPRFSSGLVEMQRLFRKIKK
jgi:hypothetical protein